MKQQVCVGAFIQNKKGQFLVVKRSDEDDYMAGMWELPGGGIDASESPQKGLQREVAEEIGLDVDVAKPLGVHTYIMETEQESIHRVEITFLCIAKKDKEVVLSFEHSDYQWILPQEVSDFDFSDYMRQVITDCLQAL